MRLTDRVHSDRFPASYYAATLKDKAPFARLEGEVTADVCIVGGGFTGVAAALHLAERGASVVLLEQNLIGWGASGRNGGQVIGGYGQEMTDAPMMEKTFGKANAQAVFDMGVECVDIIKDWVAKYKIDCDLEWGYFDAAMKQREMDELAEGMEVLKAHGYPHEQYMVSAADVKKYIGSDRYVGGRVNMGWGQVHPLNLVRGEARAAEKLGARIFEGAEVTHIAYGDKPVVTATGGKVVCDHVILGGNAYMGELVPSLAARCLPTGSYILATERLSEDLAKKLMPARFAACDQRWALDYFRMSPDRRILFGGRANYSGLHPHDLEQSIRPAMEKVFPELKDIRVEYSWGGYLGIGLNRIPQVGKLDKNIWYAQAYSGHGVAPTHMSAKIIAEAIGGDPKRFDIMASVKHLPFPGGRMFKHPLQAIGMAWYRFRDWAF
nr:FAD-binding oxidoreductase [Pseudokordiimonas caeni]